VGRLKAPPARLTAAPGGLGYAAQPEGERGRDQARRQAAALTLRHLYNTARWRGERGVRNRILTRDGWQCRMCQTMLVGQSPAPNSPVVDHITPHKGNLALFWAEDNLQALCKGCHDTEKQRIDRQHGRGMAPPGGQGGGSKG
jgi:5-methylcytosine-specific restriction enzyme A